MATRYNFTRYGTSTGAGGKLLRSGPGELGVVTVNQIGSTDSLVSIVDGTSTGGTVIANITPSSLGSFAYGVTLVSGLMLASTSSSTAELTVTWA
jgi:hypothetical protein